MTSQNKKINNPSDGDLKVILSEYNNKNLGVMSIKNLTLFAHLVFVDLLNYL